MYILCTVVCGEVVVFFCGIVFLFEKNRRQIIQKKLIYMKSTRVSSFI